MCMVKLIALYRKPPAPAEFDSRDAMDAALASPEGKAVAKDIMSFAADLITVFHGEVQE